MGLPLFIAFVATALAGRFFIPLLRRFRFGQTVRDDGPGSHLKKTGTPTMGGIFFLFPVLAVALFFSEERMEMLFMVLAILGFAVVGFIDDFIKIRKKSKDGLTVAGKTVLLLLVSTAYAVYTVLFTTSGSDMVIPFTGLTQTYIIPEYIYIPFLVLFLYLMTNSVNLSDGVDGLCSGVTIIVLLFFMLVSLFHPHWRESGLLASCFIGGLMGFLLYNVHPAKVFMGDVGSLALGGAVGIIAIYMKMPWIILVAGIVYVIEAISVVIQVGYYKKTKKRIFRMAPIHHHFELLGWSEKKITLVFCMVTLAGCLLSFLLLGLF
ncbi:MAG: phospho-N-acetylmuramoyl-pentapeptide-transferase [Clostridia bacterium]